MFVKLLFLTCCITGTYTQVSPSCKQIDFNDVNSINEFEPCEQLSVLEIKSYADVELEPFRSDAENHLSNSQIGFACLQTIETFNLDRYTEIDSIIYLNSSPTDSQSFVEIQVFDTAVGDVQTLGAAIKASDQWNFFSERFDEIVSYAKIRIHVYTSAEALLAIEYLHILNRIKAEVFCQRTTTTTTTTTVTEPTETEPTETEPTETEPTETEPTETEPTETEPTETESTETDTSPTQIPSNPIDSNDNTVWIVLSFTFVLTTIIAAATLVYLVYLYKTAVVASNSAIIASTTSSALPRLTVTSINGRDHVIVGIDSSTSVKPKYF